MQFYLNTTGLWPIDKLNAWLKLILDRQTRISSSDNYITNTRGQNPEKDVNADFKNEENRIFRPKFLVFGLQFLNHPIRELTIHFIQHTIFQNPFA